MSYIQILANIFCILILKLVNKWRLSQNELEHPTHAYWGTACAVQLDFPITFHPPLNQLLTFMFTDGTEMSAIMSPALDFFVSGLLSPSLPAARHPATNNKPVPTSRNYIVNINSVGAFIHHQCNVISHGIHRAVLQGCSSGPVTIPILRSTGLGAATMRMAM